MMWTAITLLLLTSYAHAQSTMVWSCGFEDDFCGMETGTYAVTGNPNKNDWERSNGMTPTTATGPNAAQEGDFYAYFEASFRNIDNADVDGTLTSQLITHSNQGNYRITLYFYDHGSALDQLRVRILNGAGGEMQNLKIADGLTPTQVWNFTSIQIANPPNPFRIQFVASTTGRHTADWAIDDVRVITDVVGCATDPCSSIATCTDVGNSFTCTCQLGYTGDGLKAGSGCQDINECSAISPPCTGGANVQCVNSLGSFTCVCRPGYTVATGAGTANLQCTDINECAAAVSPCTGANVMCANSVGSFSCSCMSGYQAASGVGTTALTCADINECGAAVNPCTGANVMCVNSVGSFSCACMSGYQVASGAGTTGLTCMDIDECGTAVSPCTGANAMCVNSVGSFSCACMSGYQVASGAGTTALTCMDIDECGAAVSPCTGANAMCVNSAGSFSCSCMMGYQVASGAGTTAITCVDINECGAAVNPCTGANAMCVNSVGSFSCACMSGYQVASGAGTTALTCIDINECTTIGNYCPGANTQCRNTPGSAVCECQPGFVPSSGQGTRNLICEVGLINECSNGNPCPANSFCTDQTVGFTCTCNSNFAPRAGTSGANLVCIDIDECRAAVSPCTGANVMCVNSVGSFSCACMMGYQVASGAGTTALSCSDINECNTISCDVDAQCINNPGSYECRCNVGFTQVGMQQAAVCHRNGGLTPYGGGICSVTCGSGLKTETRSCTNPPPEAGGAGCDPSEPLSRTVTCNEAVCGTCDITKPCSCDTVTQYQTGHEPNMTLLHFNNVSPGDVNTAIFYLNIWNKEHLVMVCKEAKCNDSMLTMAMNNITTYIDSLVTIDTGHKEAQTHLREVIDCNENEDIEGNLWNVYDHVCDRSISVNQVKKDLMQKKMLLEQEKKRCSERGWFGSFIEMFHKKW